MTHLNRRLAPMSEAAWERVDAEVRDVLSLHLAGRRLFEFDGPHGWSHSAIDLGKVDSLEGAAAGTHVSKRRVRPLIELRVGFALARSELDLIDRGAGRVDLEPASEAAKLFAIAEDTALFEGYADADLPGILTDGTNPGVAMPADLSDMPDVVAEALSQLRREGVAGPYAMALGPEAHENLAGTAGEGGYPVLRHVERLLEGPVLWAPALRGGVVVSLRGGDFKLVCGRDASVGYSSHDEKEVRLYIEESFSAELNGPEAAVALLPRDVPDDANAG